MTCWLGVLAGQLHEPLEQLGGGHPSGERLADHVVGDTCLRDAADLQAHGGLCGAARDSAVCDPDGEVVQDPAVGRQARRQGLPPRWAYLKARHGDGLDHQRLLRLPDRLNEQQQSAARRTLRLDADAGFQVGKLAGPQRSVQN